jgi:5-methylcytosine-specific restriction endonuclease McrA
LHKARELPKEDFRREVEKELTGREEEPSELIYFKVYKSQYESLRQQILRRDGWRCQLCGAMSNLEVHHREFRSHSGEVSEENLITLCSVCHAIMHDR